MRRSGTNYLFRLLKAHPECEALCPIWENFLLSHSNLLVRYVNNVYKNWNPGWEVEKHIGPPDMLLRYFGDALVQFLRLQINRKLTNISESDQKCSIGSQAKVLLTKTPSVKYLENFFKLFPDAYLLILIRDGRAVVESGVKSFDWDYEKAMQDWAAAARTIIRFNESVNNPEHKYLIVKYEDIYNNTEEELRKIFSFLGLSLDVYDFDAAESLGVIGSSDLRKKKQDRIHWKSTERTSDFNPLTRWSQWNRTKHERFNWIAGDYLSLLGYTPKTQRTNQFLYIAWNVLLDLGWNVQTMLKKIKMILSNSEQK